MSTKDRVFRCMGAVWTRVCAKTVAPSGGFFSMRICSVERRNFFTLSLMSASVEGGSRFCFGSLCVTHQARADQKQLCQETSADIFTTPLF